MAKKRPHKFLKLSASNSSIIEDQLNIVVANATRPSNEQETVKLTRLVGEIVDIKASSKKLVMMQGGEAITEEQMIDGVLDGMSEGLIPQEQDLYFETVETFKRTQPAKFAAWELAGGEVTTFAKGVNQKIRNRIKALGILEDENNTGVDIVDQKIEEYTRLGRIAYTSIRYKDNKDLFRSITTQFFLTNSHLNNVYDGGGALFLVVLTGNLTKITSLEGRVRIDQSNGNIVYFAAGTKDDYGYPSSNSRSKSKFTNSKAKPFNVYTSTKLTDVGHNAQEKSTGPITGTLANFEYILSVEKEQKTPRTPVIEYLEDRINDLKILLRNAIANDKLYFKVISGASVSEEQYKQAMEMAVQLGIDEILIVEEVKPGKLTFTKRKTSMGISLTASSPEGNTGNVMKGPKGKMFLRQLNLVLSGELIELSKLYVTTAMSSSAVTTVLLGALDKIFNVKYFSKLIVQGKARKKTTRFRISSDTITRQVPKFDSIANKLNKDIEENIAALKSSFNNFAFEETIPSSVEAVEYQGNIMASLNMDLKSYVLAEMVGYSLHNRTGRFADSVKVLSAQENAAVQYTYQKSPYSVFSMSKGKSPWATQARDPATIIDNAIKKLGVAKFSKVLRTEEK